MEYLLSHFKKKRKKKFDKYSEEWILWSPFQYLSYQKLC